MKPGLRDLYRAMLSSKHKKDGVVQENGVISVVLTTNWLGNTYKFTFYTKTGIGHWYMSDGSVRGWFSVGISDYLG